MTRLAILIAALWLFGVAKPTIGFISMIAYAAGYYTGRVNRHA